MAPRPDIAATEQEPDLSGELVIQKEKKYKIELVWRNILLMGALHLGSVYGAYLFLFSAKWQTILFTLFLYVISGLGITAGAHRLWSHRSYKAKWPLRLLLVIFNNVAFQNHLYEWSRDHRVHHKYSETDADPHNATRGFFFSHVGWLLCRKHPDVIEKGRGIDCSDLIADPLIRFQKKFYLPLVTLCCFLLPTYIPNWYWGESKWVAFYTCAVFRYCWTLNMTWLVNSAAHMWGRRPYDKHINPSENLGVVIGAIGEGYHNYHHTFPWDYATSELGWRLNLTTIFIDTMAWFGLAYDLRVVSPDMIRNRKNRTGDVKEKGPYGLYH